MDEAFIKTYLHKIKNGSPEYLFKCKDLILDMYVNAIAMRLLIEKKSTNIKRIEDQLKKIRDKVRRDMDL